SAASRRFFEASLNGHDDLRNWKARPSGYNGMGCYPCLHDRPPCVDRLLSPESKEPAMRTLPFVSSLVTALLAISTLAAADDLLRADESDAQRKGTGEFLRRRLTDVDKLTNEVSTVFFGVNVSCAKCHDHPLVRDWKQDHFYGMKSFFNRTFDNGGFLAERDYGTVKFKTTKGQDKQAKLMFLTGMAIDGPEVKEPNGEEQKKEKALLEEFKKKKMAPPPPS